MNFVDTNILVYFSDLEERRYLRAAEIVEAGGIVSVQVLNEITNVLRSKSRLDWTSIDAFLGLMQTMLSVTPLTLHTHRTALQLAQRYGVHIYDANILAAALLAGCDTLYSEDMQNGLLVEGRLRVVNPFA